MTSSPAPRTTILRPDDLLLLDLDFININLETGDGKSARLVPVTGKKSYIIVHFPPQNIAEEAFFETGNLNLDDFKPKYVTDLGQPDPDTNKGDEAITTLPVMSRMSGGSQLVFEVPESVKDIPYTIEGLLNWKDYTMRVAPTALPQGQFGDRPAIQDPSSINPPVTALELPYRLIISPDNTASWTHLSNLEHVTHGGRTELWHTRLGVNPGANLQGITNPLTVRAIWSPDYNPQNHSTLDDPKFPGSNIPFRMSLNAFDRHQIVRLSSDYNIKSQSEYYDPQPISVEKLMLSSLGAWIDSRGFWEDPIDQLLYKALRIDQGLIVNEWKHIAAQGRDQFARVVYQGCLFPFGNKASLIKVTERKVADLEKGPLVGDTLAYLSQKMFIIVRQPEISYSDDLYGNTQGRDNPFRSSIKITTLMTPAIDAPVPIPGTGAFWVKVNVNGTSMPFPFHIIAKDEEGQPSEFTAAMIFIPADQCANWPGPIQQVKDDYGKSPDRVCNLHGQKVAFAKRNPDKGGDTTLITEEMYFDVKKVSLPPNVTFSPVSYLPILDGDIAASVRMPAVEQLLGMDKATNIKQAEKYLEKGLSDETENRARVFAEITDNLELSVPPDKAGGLAGPKMDLTGISQDLGPVAGKLDDLVTGKFNPKDFFKVDAKLLGGIKLQDIIAGFTGPFDEDQFKGRFPKITSKQDPPSGKPTSIITTLDWSSEVQPQPGSTFIKYDDTKLDIHSTIVKRLDASEPTYLITGNLNHFDINFASVITVSFKSLSFSAKKGEKLDVSAELNGVSFSEDGPLNFVNTLSEYLPSSSNPGFSDPPSLDVSAEGVTIGYTLGLPPLAVGVFALQNVNLSAGLSLPFVNKPACLSFAFSERHHPFLLTVSLFAGGGFFAIALGPDGIQMIEASLEFGGNISINLGVASGGVYVMAGIYFKYDKTKSDALVELTGYFRCGGGLEVLGIISVSVEFYLGLSYRSSDNKVWGQATLTVTVEVLFFSKSVSLTVEKTFAGAGNDPTFGDLVSTYNDWTDYAGAFA
jgi:hypothetical protein